MPTSFLRPCFQYNPGGGNVNWVPTYPPINKLPLGSMNAVRHDSITSSGRKQSVLERIDMLNTFEFATVPQTDLDGWFAFFSWALSGNVFTWFADSTNLTGGIQYTLEDTAWDPKRTSFQNFAFTLGCRRVVHTFVNGNAAATAPVAMGTTASVTLTKVVLGNTLLVTFSSDCVGNNVPGLTITDNFGSVYTFLGSIIASGTDVYVYMAVAAGAGTVTVSASGAISTFRRLMTVTQLEGVTALDGAINGASGISGTIPGSFSASYTPGANVLLFSICHGAGISLSDLFVTAGQGWTQYATAFSPDADAIAAAVKGPVLAAQGLQSVTWNQTQSNGYSIALFGIKF